MHWHSIIDTVWSDNWTWTNHTAHVLQCMIIYDNTYNTLPTERKFSLEFKCHYLTNSKFPINLNPAYY